MNNRDCSEVEDRKQRFRFIRVYFMLCSQRQHAAQKAALTSTHMSFIRPLSSDRSSTASIHYVMYHIFTTFDTLSPGAQKSVRFNLKTGVRVREQLGT